MRKACEYEGSVAKGSFEGCLTAGLRAVAPGSGREECSLIPANY